MRFGSGVREQRRAGSAIAAAVVAVLLVACSSDPPVDEPDIGSENDAISEPVEAQIGIPGTDVDGCDRRTIGEEFGPVLVAYGAERGDLADQPCLGEADSVVVEAWNALAAVAPTELVEAVVLVAGFDDTESDTLAFAGPLDNDTEEHLIAVGVAAAVDDPDELRLTMAHELAHVFTQTTEQIDVALFEDECDTFFNGFGCFQPDAYITAWVDQFWDPQEIASLPEDYSADIDGGEERCLDDPAFPGAYAASHPEEDFAESFSAYVFDVELPPEVDERLAFFDEYPEFVAMRDAARSSSLPTPPSNFDICG